MEGNNLNRNTHREDIFGFEEHTWGTSWPARNFACSFCMREFSSAQALGGHMNIHRTDRARLRSVYKMITLKSSDKVVYKMDKMAAITESMVLKDLIDSTGGRDEIPVPLVYSTILDGVVSFCEKKHDFHNLFKSVVDRYKAWITGFLNTNQAILSGLNKAADFLNIPSLLDLTSQAMGDMMGKTLEEISQWYARVSIPRILSSLGVGEEVRNQGVGPSAFA